MPHLSLYTGQYMSAVLLKGGCHIYHCIQVSTCPLSSWKMAATSITVYRSVHVRCPHERWVPHLSLYTGQYMSAVLLKDGCHIYHCIQVSTCQLFSWKMAATSITVYRSVHVSCSHGRWLPQLYTGHYMSAVFIEDGCHIYHCIQVITCQMFS